MKRLFSKGSVLVDALAIGFVFAAVSYACSGCATVDVKRGASYASALELCEQSSRPGDCKGYVECRKAAAKAFGRSYNGWCE